MIDDKIARVKKLIQQRETIDAELAAIFGLAESPKRGRPRKETNQNEASESLATQTGIDQPSRQTTPTRQA